ncbi:Crp/Fnr family transcriptional regulator [Acrocarpospora catenulata]|uniref:Crp/Fnr family transcriptional regulator n=1 Tax=Acrocarpospora catenulata TaxID=2836182 RepID=UPI001BDB5E4A|nr:Crp/Fnr family transcriptional regulator [Acrocarpospora catenulata]
MIQLPTTWPAASLMGRLSRDDQLALARIGTTIARADRTALLLEAVEGNEVYLILDGFVKITAAGGTGNERLLAIRPRGELVGEFAALDDAPRSATATTSGPATLVRIGAGPFLNLLRTRPDITIEVARSVVRKLRYATARRVYDHAGNATARLARVIYELVTEYGERNGTTIVLDMALTQLEMATMAGIAESTAESALAKWRRAGILQTRYRRMTVHDLDRLRAAAEIA